MVIKRFGICLVALLLTACGSNSATGPDEASSSLAPTPSSSLVSESATPTEIPTETPTPVHYAMLTCYDSDYNEVQVNAADLKVLHRAWKNPEALDCTYGPEIYASTPIETAAASAASSAYKTYKAGDVSGLYELCISVDNQYAGLDLGAKQAAEVRGMLILCPNHPLAKKFRNAIARGESSAAAESNGTQFSDGTHRVNRDIKPGTYVVTNAETCYWERQDSNGNIIDNYITSSALRVQVTIRSSDYAFYSARCGVWKKG